MSEFICNLEKKSLDEFISTITNQNIASENEDLKFKFSEIYMHIIQCEEHNNYFAKHLKKLVKYREDPHILAENVKYLSSYIHSKNGITN